MPKLPGHYLALACRQQLITVSQLGKLALLLARQPVAIESLVDCVEQSWSRKGLVRNSIAPDFMAFTVIGMSP